MPKGWKSILFVVAGVFAGGVCLATIEAIGHSLFNKNAAFIVAAIGLGIAGLVGGSVAVWLGKRPQLAYVVGVLLAGLTLVNVFSFTHPIWFVPAAFALLAIGIWFPASHIGKKPNSKT